AGLEGEDDIGKLGEVLLRVGAKVGGQAGNRSVESGCRPSGEEQELPGTGGAAELRLRRLFQNHVGVGTAHAEGADAGPPGRAGSLPFAGVGIDVERAVLEIDLRVRR